MKKEISKNLKLMNDISDILKIHRWASVNLILDIYNSPIPSIIMIRRAKNPLDPWSGHYAFPGGKVEKGEGLLTAALRETWEEIGVGKDNLTPIGEFYRLQISRSGGKLLPYAISAHLSLLVDTTIPFRIDKKEVDEVFRFSLESLTNPQFLIEKEFTFKNHSEVLPCIEFEGHVIWGLSLKILSVLLGQLSNVQIGNWQFPEYKSFVKTL